MTIVIVISLYYTNVDKFAVDLPNQDDYMAILNYLCIYHKSDFGEKIALLFSPHNEHRLLFSRIVFIIEDALSHHISFRHLIFVDFSLLVLIYAGLVLLIKRCLPNSWQYAAVICAFCLFNLNNYENAENVTAGMFNYSVILLLLLSIISYSKADYKFIVLGVVAQVFCIYSGGNGVIGALFIFLYTAFSGNKMKIIASGIVFLVCVPLYYLNAPDRVAALGAETTTIIKIFLTAIGGSFGLQYALVIGVMLIVSYIILMPIRGILKIEKNALPLICIAGFAFASLAAMSYFRRTVPIEFATSSRYLIYSHLLYVIAVVFMFYRVDKMKLHLAVVVFTAISYLLTYNPGTVLFEGFRNTVKGTDFYFPNKEYAKQITDESCKLKIYCIEEARSKIK